ncbi:hypothetical protein C1H46_041508 [Malus baccata]|uniref:Uncharacterized protein n=1 Tax=Malus baccata TaxID=106549 RepID=A0A540KFE5_MALBA|nr:hypothetical protein C1H46_041508 [Malus baccata]
MPVVKLNHTPVFAESARIAAMLVIATEGGNARGTDEAAIGIENGDGQFVWPVTVEDELAKLYRGDYVLYLEVTYLQEHPPPSHAGKQHLFC